MENENKINNNLLPKSQNKIEQTAFNSVGFDAAKYHRVGGSTVVALGSP